jgi:hypothetical protein
MVRMWRVIGAVCAAAVLGGCGDDASEPGQTPAPTRAATAPATPTTEPGFDPDDPAISIIPEDGKEIDALVSQAGKRDDFRIPRGVAAGKPDGPLLLAWVARPFYEPPAGDAWIDGLNPGQRAVYSMFVADFEILNGGFYQLWTNSSGYIADDLAASAELVGSKEFASIFRDAAALWPGGEIPRSRSKREQIADGFSGAELDELDNRYAETQYARKTALGPILARYIRANPDQFVAD